MLIGSRVGRVIRICGLCFMEARPVVQVVFLLRLLAGAFFAGSVLSLEFGGESFVLLVIGAASWACATLAVYIYNGVEDVEEDRLNGSSRPIARGELSVSQAMVAVGVLGTLSITGGVFVHHDLAWGAAAMLVMGWLYSGPPFYLKRWPAALAVIAAVAAVLTYNTGYTLSGSPGERLPLLVFAGFMALWMGLVGQTKDLSDVPGDKKAGRRSLPVTWGEETARLAISVVALALGIGFLIIGLFQIEGLLLAAITVFVGALAVSALSLGPWGRGGRARRRRPYGAFMITQYAANIVVIAFPVSV